MTTIKKDFAKWYQHCLIVNKKGRSYNTEARMKAISKITKYTQAYMNRPDHDFKLLLRNVLRHDLNTILPSPHNNSHTSSLHNLHKLLA